VVIPKGERGEFTGIGVYNQYLFVDPSRGVVIVKLSANPLHGTSKGEETNQDVENIESIRAIAAQFN
jgi:CubicO group peptidase (beta-lactamase class C family)